MLTMNEARNSLKVPADKANNTAVQDAQARLREELKLAETVRDDAAPAPSYVREAVANLRSWL